MMDQFYVGLATTFHDPAVAIVDPDGAVLFAEATERHLQYKRAYNCEPDSTPRMAELLKTHIPHDAELVIATSWSERFSSYVQRVMGGDSFDVASIAATGGQVSGSLGGSPSTERAFLSALELQQRRAGLGTLIGMEQAFGTARIAGQRRYPHHRAHAAFATLASPFDEAACLVVDGMGEANSVSLFHHHNGQLDEVRGRFGTLSPGFLYGLLTDLAGFDSKAGEEWKLMGLAPYGQPDPKLAGLVRQLYRTDNRGRPVRTTTEAATDAAATIAALRPAETDTDGWADLAYAAQDVFSDLMDYYLDHADQLIPSSRLVLTGGCALNSSFNGTITARCGFDTLFVPSAPADDGNAVGAALLAWADDHPGVHPNLDRPLTPYLGSSTDTATLQRQAHHDPRLQHVGDGIIERAADLLAAGRLVGWMQGRAEFGPRALGNRSILADPRPGDAKDLINARVKYREGFRPFAPSILADHATDWFDNFQPSPYMDRTLQWRPTVQDRVPAVVHVDGTGRLQTVTRTGNPRFHDLITAFEDRTGVPILLNTSLNVMGKPIAHSTTDALALFYTSGLDALVIDDWLITKSGVN